MHKILKFLAFLFAAIVILITMLVFSNQQNLFNYLNAINSIDPQSSNWLNNLRTELNKETGTGAASFDILNNPKFKRLTKNTVDLTGLNLTLPMSTSTATSTATSTDDVNFKVGNKSPFKVFKAPNSVNAPKQ